MTAPVMWVVGEFRVLHWCRPMPACISGNKMWHPDDHLIWCPKVDSGPHTFTPLWLTFLVNTELVCELSLERLYFPGLLSVLDDCIVHLTGPGFSLFSPQKISCLFQYFCYFPWAQKHKLIPLITARQWRDEGNVFSLVCHSVCP